MMKQPVTLQQRRSRETRTLLLDAAQRAVGRRGYAAATVEDIAEEAGASVGTLYYHFPGKEDLLRSFFRDYLRAAIDGFEALPPPASLHDAIETTIEFWLNQIESSAHTSPLMLEFWAQAAREDWAREEASATYGRFRGLVADMLRGGQEGGLVRGDVEPRAAAYLIVSLLEGVSLQNAIDPAGTPLASLRRELVDLVQRFLTDEPAQRESQA